MPSPSYLRVTKSETRDLAEHEVRTRRASQSDTSADPQAMSNGRFFAAFVVIVGLLAVLALALR
jgi:hypothetical protein